jgi:ankyrin repeat protein
MLVKLCLEHGADPTYANTSASESTPLHTSITYAVDYSAMNHIPIDNNWLEIVKILAQKKVCLEIKTKDGLTPLMLAIQENWVDAAQVLLQAGADPNAFGRNFTGMLDYAKSQEMKDLINYYREKKRSTQ